MEEGFRNLIINISNAIIEIQEKCNEPPEEVIECLQLTSKFDGLTEEERKKLSDFLKENGYEELSEQLIKTESKENYTLTVINDFVYSRFLAKEEPREMILESGLEEFINKFYELEREQLKVELNGELNESLINRVLEANLIAYQEDFTTGLAKIRDNKELADCFKDKNKDLEFLKNVFDDIERADYLLLRHFNFLMNLSKQEFKELVESKTGRPYKVLLSSMESYFTTILGDTIVSKETLEGRLNILSKIFETIENPSEIIYQTFLEKMNYTLCDSQEKLQKAKIIGERLLKARFALLNNDMDEFNELLNIKGYEYIAVKAIKKMILKKHIQTISNQHNMSVRSLLTDDMSTKEKIKTIEKYVYGDPELSVFGAELVYRIGLNTCEESDEFMEKYLKKHKESSDIMVHSLEDFLKWDKLKVENYFNKLFSKLRESFKTKEGDLSERVYIPLTELSYQKIKFIKTIIEDIHEPLITYTKNKDKLRLTSTDEEEFKEFLGEIITYVKDKRLGYAMNDDEQKRHVGEYIDELREQARGLMERINGLSEVSTHDIEFISGLTNTELIRESIDRVQAKTNDYETDLIESLSQTKESLIEISGGIEVYETTIKKYNESISKYQDKTQELSEALSDLSEAIKNKFRQ